MPKANRVVYPLQGYPLQAAGWVVVVGPCVAGQNCRWWWQQLQVLGFRHCLRFLALLGPLWWRTQGGYGVFSPSGVSWSVNLYPPVSSLLILGVNALLRAWKRNELPWPRASRALCGAFIVLNEGSPPHLVWDSTPRWWEAVVPPFHPPNLLSRLQVIYCTCIWTDNWVLKN